MTAFQDFVNTELPLRPSIGTSPGAVRYPRFTGVGKVLEARTAAEFLADIAAAALVHASRHQNGGADEISVTGLSGLLADAQTPASHNIVDHDTTATGANLTELTDSSETTLHSHAGGGGVTDHGALTGLADDDHSQYHNDTRGDARYHQLGGTDVPVTDGGTGASDAATARTNLGAAASSDVTTHAALTATHGVSGAIVGTSDTQALTNKTITAPILVLQAGGSPTPTAEGRIWWDNDDDQIKIGDGTGTLAFSDDSNFVAVADLANHMADTSTHGVTGIAGLNEAQTLSNKTLNSPIIAATSWGDANHDHSTGVKGGQLDATTCFSGGVTGADHVVLKTSPIIITPTLYLFSSSSPTPTTEGQIQWDNNDDRLAVGDGAGGTKIISPDDVAATLTNKTLTTPTIGDLTLATHDHADAAGGGTIARSAVTGTTAISEGGTGQTTAQAAIDALSAVSGATIGHVLTKSAGGNAVFEASAGGGLSDVVDDLTPQLGGDLDVNGKAINAASGDILFERAGTRVGNWNSTGLSIGSFDSADANAPLYITRENPPGSVVVRLEIASATSTRFPAFQMKKSGGTSISSPSNVTTGHRIGGFTQQAYTSGSWSALGGFRWEMATLTATELLFAAGTNSTYLMIENGGDITIETADARLGFGGDPTNLYIETSSAGFKTNVLLGDGYSWYIDETLGMSLDNTQLTVNFSGTLAMQLLPAYMILGNNHAKIRWNTVSGEFSIDVGANQMLAMTNNALSWFNGTPAAKQTVTGSRGGNAALASLLTAFANYGLIVDSTTA